MVGPRDRWNHELDMKYHRSVSIRFQLDPKSRQPHLLRFDTGTGERHDRTERPPRWSEDHVRKVSEHYENQTDGEAVAEDEAATESTEDVMMGVPVELVPAVRELIARHRKA
jgi:hypothetical protein